MGGTSITGEFGTYNSTLLRMALGGKKVFRLHFFRGKVFLAPKKVPLLPYCPYMPLLAPVAPLP